jgi:hypothetical protein
MYLYEAYVHQLEKVKNMWAYVVPSYGETQRCVTAYDYMFFGLIHRLVVKLVAWLNSYCSIWFKKAG